MTIEVKDVKLNDVNVKDITVKDLVDFLTEVNEEHPMILPILKRHFFKGGESNEQAGKTEATIQCGCKEGCNCKRGNEDRIARKEAV
ncbi:MAG: hypothetical protein N3B21_19450 [Clostridia bacterium]|nr:hypothetical protein [Clostridia bacterium]